MVSTSKPASGCATSLRDDQVEALARAACSAALLDEVVGLGREADQHLARALVAPEVDEDVVGGLEHDLGDAVVLLELAVRRRLGPEVGDRRRHHDRRRRRRRRASTASCISAAVSTAHDLDARRAPGGRWW